MHRRSSESSWSCRVTEGCVRAQVRQQHRPETPREAPEPVKGAPGIHIRSGTCVCSGDSAPLSWLSRTFTSAGMPSEATKLCGAAAGSEPKRMRAAAAAHVCRRVLRGSGSTRRCETAWRAPLAVSSRGTTFASL